MTRKSKRKKRKRKQKKVHTVPPPQHLPIVAKASRHGLLLTVLGLVLTAIGLVALIELFPRLSASATATTDLDDVLGSSKFTITNEGYLKVTDVSPGCFLWNVTVGRPGASAQFNSGVVRVAQPPEAKLPPTEGFTTPCGVEGRPIVGTSPPFTPLRINRADLAIIVYYRAWPFTFYRDHRLFRFVAHFARGAVTWEKQPADVMEPDFAGWLAQHGGTFPPLLVRPPNLH